MDRIQYLKDNFDVPVHHEYVYEDRGDGRQRYELPDVVRSVWLDLTPTQWMSIAMREPPDSIPSSYVGGCCGNMSYVQDIINGSFRDGGHMDGSDLLTVGRMMRDHDGGEFFAVMDDDEFFEFADKLRRTEARGNDFAMPDPWARIAVIFGALENTLTPNMLSPLRPDKIRADYPEDEKVMHVAERTLRYMSFSQLFTSKNPEDSYKDESDEAREKRHRWDRIKDASHDAERAQNFARLLYPVRRLNEMLDERDDVFEGWAIIDPETREPLRAGMGPCYFRSREDADWLVGVWARTAESAERRDIPEANRDGVPEHEIVPVRVTATKGLEIL